MEAAATMPVKLTLSGTKRRVRLNMPLKFEQLCQTVRVVFQIKDFQLEYVDEEADRVIVDSEPDLQEAQRVFKDLGRVPSFVVKKVVPKSTPYTGRDCNSGRHIPGRRPLVKVFDFPDSLMKSIFAGSAIHCGVVCDGSNQNPLLGVRYHKIGHNYDLNEAEFSKLSPKEQQKYEIISHPNATPVPVTGSVIHHGVVCDGSNQNPLLGVRYHKIGHNYDLNEAEFSKLSPKEQQKYEIISHPNATPVPVTNAPLDCVFVRDVTIPDGQVISPGQQFNKSWLVKTGVTGWPNGCKLACVNGDKMGATCGIALGPQNPHKLVPVSINFTAPSRPGKITSKWRVVGPDGKLFGHTLWVTIIVKPSGASAVASAVAPQLPSASVAETHHASASASAASATASASPPSTSGALQQLLEMGFALPVDKLQRVLDSVGGNVPAAVTALFHNKY